MFGSSQGNDHRGAAGALAALVVALLGGCVSPQQVPSDGGGRPPSGSGGTFGDTRGGEPPGPTDTDPRLPNGAACTEPRSCRSELCVDGVCCDSLCDGACRSCALPGSLGMCRPVDVGSDPENECSDEGPLSCGSDGVCDGAGNCRKYAVGTFCAEPECADGNSTLAGACDGRGACKIPDGPGCGKYLCDVTACRTTCTAASDCVPPSVCSMDSCGGLVGRYFANNTWLGGAALVRTDPTIDFAWGAASPGGVIPTNNFSVRWTGKLTPRFSEMYTFHLTADDGARLTVNGMVVIDALADHDPATEVMGQIALNGNRTVNMELDFRDLTGAAGIRLSWSSLSEAKAVIPTSALWPP